MTPNYRATGQDIADAIVEFGHLCNIAEGKTAVEATARLKAKLEGLADARMVVIPPGTAIQITEVVYAMCGEKWPDDDTIVRAREVGERLAKAYHEHTLHAPLTPLWISADDNLPDAELVGLYFKDGCVRAVDFAERRIMRTGDGEMRSACVTVSNVLLPPAVAAETPEYEMVISLALPALVIAEHIRRHPTDLERVPPSFRTRAASKMVGRTSGVRRSPPPVYTLPVEVDRDAIRQLVQDIIEEEETMLPRVAVVGGDDRIFRQSWSSSTLDIRPYIGDDARRVAEASRAGKLDAIVVLARFVGHAQYDLLKQLSTPVVLWRRGLPELAKVLTNVTAVNEIEAAIRQADGLTPPANADNAVPEAQDKAEPPQIDHALLTWGASLRDILATENREWTAEELALVLDATDYRTDIDAALAAMVVRGDVILHDHDGVAHFTLPLDQLDTAIAGPGEPAVEDAADHPEFGEAPIAPPALPAPKEAPMIQSPISSVPGVPVAQPAVAPETVLVSWTVASSEINCCVIVDRDRAVETMEKLLANPTNRNVRLWRAAKVRVRVEIE